MQHNTYGKSVLSTALLLFVVIAAGCVGQSILEGFGSDVIKPSRTSTSTGVSDPVMVENVHSLPESPLNPGQSVSMFMNIVSMDSDPQKVIENVYINLFDAHVFKNDAGEKCNLAPTNCLPTRCGSSDVCKLHANEIIPIEYKLRAPTVVEIANIITQSSLNWLARYNYSTSTNYDVLLVSEEEIRRLQQEGQTLSVAVQDTQGPGAIKIALSAKPEFALPGQDIYVTLKLTNVGSGFTEGRIIGIGKLKVIFPSSIGTVEEQKDYFACINDYASGDSVCTNSRAIDFFKKETTPLQFIITTDENALQGGIPHRAYTITAFLAYTYELRGSMILEVVPPQLG